ncbi:MAG: threonylcarbamoyl-AMP synthase [Firmicutes bacterium]|nr:threonylcarbamoyl-AMP synthase [Bacillota bacterium]
MQLINGTKVIRVKQSYDLVQLEEAGRIIRGGGLVAFPTETVYGLGGNALDPMVAASIYAAKRRPADNPLIVHVARPQEIMGLVRDVPPVADRLIKRFWPGPLTLVFAASDCVPKETRGGLSTVAVRMPAHPVALALIEMSGCPLAGPSANISGRPSPTTAEHVVNDLAGRIQMIIDSGPTGVGVESTVLDVTVTPPQILRPGGLTLEQLREEISSISVDPAIIQTSIPRGIKARAPGMKYKHYAPKAELVVVEGRPADIVAKICILYDDYVNRGKRVAIMATTETIHCYGARKASLVGAREDLATVAANLFSLLRQLDAEGIQIILAEGVDMVGLGLAVMNRLRKAAGYRIIKA